MIKLYVVRCSGDYMKDFLHVSADYEVTMLESITCWSSGYLEWESSLASAAEICYKDFRRLTGITLLPGEYTTIKIGETKP